MHIKGIQLPIIATMLTGPMFFLSGKLSKKIINNKSIVMGSSIVVAILFLTCYTYVGMRENLLHEGFYVLWPVQSIASIIVFNSLFTLIYQQARIKTLEYIGEKSMIFYVAHLPLLLIAKTII